MFVCDKRKDCGVVGCGKGNPHDRNATPFKNVVEFCLSINSIVNDIPVCWYQDEEMYLQMWSRVKGRIVNLPKADKTTAKDFLSMVLVVIDNVEYQYLETNKENQVS